MTKAPTTEQEHSCLTASTDHVWESHVIDRKSPHGSGRDIEEGGQMNGTVCEEDYMGLGTVDPLRPLARDADARIETLMSQSLDDPATEEQRLIARCIRGEDAAWETVFQVYHPRLVAYISFLTRGGSKEQADEVAAAVWCSLCCGASTQLGRYDPEAGGLLRCLKHLARGEIWRRRRSEQSRRRRECKAARKESTRDEVGHELVLEEFLATLTRRELEFCLSDLLSMPEFRDHTEVSTCNVWKLRSRVMKKFRTYVLRNN